MTDVVFDWLLNVIGDARVVVIILAILPISEARLAIPVAIKYGIPPFEAFLYGFLGSSAAAALLLLSTLPLIKLLAKTRLFKRIGETILTRAQTQADKIGGGAVKKIIGTGAFVALPLPLTGVWTGSAVAGILGLDYLQSLAAVVGGNLLAAAIVTVTAVFFGEYINILVAVFAAVALFAVVALLIKAFRRKKTDNAEPAEK